MIPSPHRNSPQTKKHPTQHIRQRQVLNIFNISSPQSFAFNAGFHFTHAFDASCWVPHCGLVQDLFSDADVTVRHLVGLTRKVCGHQWKAEWIQQERSDQFGEPLALTAGMEKCGTRRFRQILLDEWPESLVHLCVTVIVGSHLQGQAQLTENTERVRVSGNRKNPRSENSKDFRLTQGLQKGVLTAAA